VPALVEESEELPIVEGGVPALRIEQVRVRHLAARRRDLRVVGDE
jgi:hypothetical protein